MKKKLSLFCGVEEEAIALLPNAKSIYQVPLTLEDTGIGDIICKKLGLKTKSPDMKAWRQTLAAAMKPKKQKVKVGVVAKYMDNQDTYMSVFEALRSAAWANDVDIEIHWIEAENLENQRDITELMEAVDGIVLPGGFGTRGLEGKIKAARYALQNKKPYLGLCLGLQMAVVAAAREAGLKDATSEELNPRAKHRVIHTMADQRGKENTGGSMRLGDYPCKLEKGSLSAKPDVQKRRQSQEPKPDPAKIKLEAELQALKLEQQKKEDEEKRRLFEEEIRRKTEEEYKIREEARRKAMEDAKKEFERAKAEAERQAREKLDAERKQEAEKAKAHAEMMARIQREAKEKYEAEVKAAEERKKAEELARVEAEAAARRKFEEKLKADAEAEAAAEKKAAEEAEAKKKWEEEAKDKAEADARDKLAAEAKAAAEKAAADAQKKKDDDDMKKKAAEEATAKYEADLKKKTDKSVIKFKDAVGRKFAFPFHVCRRWEVRKWYPLI